jgi:hypothetical protein
VLRRAAKFSLPDATRLSRGGRPRLDGSAPAGLARTPRPRRLATGGWLRGVAALFFSCFSRSRSSDLVASDRATILATPVGRAAAAHSIISRRIVSHADLYLSTPIPPMNCRKCRVASSTFAWYVARRCYAGRSMIGVLRLLIIVPRLLIIVPRLLIIVLLGWHRQKI